MYISTCVYVCVHVGLFMRVCMHGWCNKSIHCAYLHTYYTYVYTYIHRYVSIIAYHQLISTHIIIRTYIILLIVGKSQCTENDAAVRGGAATVTKHKKPAKVNNNSRIPVPKYVKGVMTAEDFDRIHQKSFDKLVMKCVLCNFVCCVCYVCVGLKQIFEYLD